MLAPINDDGINREFNLNEEGQLSIDTYKYGIVTKIRWYGEKSNVICITGKFKYESFEVFVKTTPKLKEHLNKIFMNEIT